MFSYIFVSDFASLNLPHIYHQLFQRANNQKQNHFAVSAQPQIEGQDSTHRKTMDGW